MVTDFVRPESAPTYGDIDEALGTTIITLDNGETLILKDGVLYHLVQIVPLYSMLTELSRIWMAKLSLTLKCRTRSCWQA
ncbi:hypothetical protein O9992_21875 [Vibrio lentus]|nr:hypothetical protein [Vibrio lentus]